MKRFAMVLLALAALIPFAFEASAKGGKGKISFDEYTYDFGVIQEAKGPVSHDFKFINAGDGNLVIVDCTAQCGCTRPEFPKNPIAPAKSGKVKVTYNPLGRPGAFEKTVTVKTNGSPSKVRLKIKGNVTPKNK